MFKRRKRVDPFAAAYAVYACVLGIFSLLALLIVGPTLDGVAAGGFGIIFALLALATQAGQ